MFVWLHSGIGRGQISEVRIIPVEISKVLSAYIMAKAPLTAPASPIQNLLFISKAQPMLPRKSFRNFRGEDHPSRDFKSSRVFGTPSVRAFLK